MNYVGQWLCLTRLAMCATHRAPWTGSDLRVVSQVLLPPDKPAGPALHRMALRFRLAIREPARGRHR